MTETATHAAFEERRLTVRDGLQLYVRHYPAPGATRRAALCLPGLTRNARDFEVLAAHLSTGAAARPVYTLDARGRGGSDHDRDPTNYALPVEMQDVIDMLIAYDIGGAALIGTSRGGLATMLLAAAQPTLIGAAVLNDIGPVLEFAGLQRIAGYVGKTSAPATWAEAAAAVKRIDGPFFPAVPEDKWEAIARQRFAQADGRPAPGYDPKLAQTLALPESGEVPTLWPQFVALKGVPVMVVRGEMSDLLSAATVAQMQARHGRVEVVTVPGQGHAPLLDDRPTLDAISAFLVKADAGAAHGV